MKQTIKTSRVAGQLEKMFRALNSRFFDGELPEVVISLKKTAFDFQTVGFCNVLEILVVIYAVIAGVLYTVFGAILVYHLMD